MSVKILEKHWQQLLELREEYIGHALSTKPVERQKLEGAIADVYQQIFDRPPPKQILWFDSPIEAQMCAAIWSYILDPHVHCTPLSSLEEEIGDTIKLNVAMLQEDINRVRADYPTLYTETEKPLTLLSELCRSHDMLLPDPDNGDELRDLCSSLRTSILVISNEPLRLALMDFTHPFRWKYDIEKDEFAGTDASNLRTHLANGAVEISMFGDGWLRSISDVITFGLIERLNSVGDPVTELCQRVIPQVTEGQDRWIKFATDYSQATHQLRDEITRFLIGETQRMSVFWPVTFAMGCAYERACELMQLNRIPRLSTLDQAIRAGGWWWPFEDVCIVMDNPLEFHVDVGRRLHNPDGPALRFRDGFTLSAIWGRLVPEMVIANQFCANDIDAAQNSEVRSIMIDKYGLERYMTESGAEEIQRDECGILYRKSFNLEEPVMSVQVTNSTESPDGGFRAYWLRVPPHITSAREGVAWSFGLEKDEYDPTQQT